MHKHIFISGIDTDCGKTYITSKIAKLAIDRGINCITSKFVQTGCAGISEDLLEHRKEMGVELFKEDKDGTTCPFVYSFPASPHLSASIDNTVFDIDKVKQSFAVLKAKYDIVITEGAGGLTVPLTDDYFTSDFLEESKIPMILVTSSKLGSINHTLLNIEYCITNGINIKTIIYNKFDNHDKLIAEDSFLFLKRFLEKKYPNINIIHSEELNTETVLDVLS